LAQQLAGRSEVAAFDLVNEAHPPGPTFSIKQARWDALAERLVRTVRAVDPARKIVLEPSPGARPMAFRTATLLPFENLIYSVHMYEPFEFTHQRVGDARFTGVVDYPGLIPGQGLWNRERLLAELAPVQQFAQQHGVEIFVGEFGAPRWAPNAARLRYLRDLLLIFDTWGWSWTYHGWREWHGWDAEMGADETRHERRANEPAYQLLRDALNACAVPASR
jgi:endoglucanase